MSNLDWGIKPPKKIPFYIRVLGLPGNPARKRSDSFQLDPPTTKKVGNFGAGSDGSILSGQSTSNFRYHEIQMSNEGVENPRHGLISPIRWRFQIFFLNVFPTITSLKVMSYFLTPYCVQFDPRWQGRSPENELSFNDEGVVLCSKAFNDPDIKMEEVIEFILHQFSTKLVSV